MLDNELRKSTEYFKDWMCPVGCYYGGGTTIIQEGRLFGTVTLFRSEQRKNFSEKELYLLSVLNGHLSVRLSQLFPHGIRCFSNQDDHSIDPAHGHLLTLREQQIICLVREGHSNQEIGVILFISPATVKKHLSNIFDKLEIKSRTQLIKLMRDHLPEINGDT